MDYETFDRIFYFSVGAICVPLAFLLARYRRLPSVLRALTYLLAFSFLCDFINEVQHLTIHLPVNYLGNAYYIFSPVLISIFFYHAIGRNGLQRPLIIFNVAYFLFSIANFLLIQKTSINTYSAIIEKLLIMMLSILYFYNIIREMPAARIYYLGLFWIISAMFIVSSAKLVLYTFAHYLVVFKDNLIVLWSIHNMLSIILSLAIAAGILVHYRAREAAEPQSAKR